MRIPPPWRRFAAACGLAAALLMRSGGTASAHAHLVQADPAPDSVIAAAPRVATFVFDEPLNPALTRVRVTTATGTAVTTTPGHLAPGHNGELWRLPLPALRPGTYSVIWISESATDGHIMSSFYTFRVASSGGTAGAGAVTGTAGGVYGGGAGAGGVSGRPGGAVAVALTTWLGLMAQALWLGALMIDLAVLWPARQAWETPEAHLAAAAGRRLCRLTQASLIIVLVALSPRRSASPYRGRAAIGAAPSRPPPSPVSSRARMACCSRPASLYLWWRWSSVPSRVRRGLNPCPRPLSRYHRRWTSSRRSSRSHPGRSRAGH